MELKLGVLAVLEAKPEKAGEVKEFLLGGRAIVEQEPGTRTWYAFRIDDTHFGIFDTFADEDARQAHLNGAIPRALGEQSPELLATDPDLRTVDLLAVKYDSGA